MSSTIPYNQSQPARPPPKMPFHGCGPFMPRQSPDGFAPLSMPPTQAQPVRSLPSHPQHPQLDHGNATVPNPHGVGPTNFNPPIYAPSNHGDYDHGQAGVTMSETGMRWLIEGQQRNHLQRGYGIYQGGFPPQLHGGQAYGQQQHGPGFQATPQYPVWVPDPHAQPQALAETRNSPAQQQDLTETRQSPSQPQPTECGASHRVHPAQPLYSVAKAGEKGRGKDKKIRKLLEITYHGTEQDLATSSGSVTATQANSHPAGIASAPLGGPRALSAAAKPFVPASNTQTRAKSNLPRAQADRKATWSQRTKADSELGKLTIKQDPKQIFEAEKGDWDELTEEMGEETGEGTPLKCAKAAMSTAEKEVEDGAWGFGWVEKGMEEKNEET